MGQTQDWMAEIYPLWVAAHGVMIVIPVNWYQVSSPIKLMMDRLVCADGGNPDPTLTDGKDVALAKKLELSGWDYPRHLAGRAFSVIVHGDVAGVENVRRSLSDWLKFMKLVPAGSISEVDRYIGYWEPYATNHLAPDQDQRCRTKSVMPPAALALQLCSNVAAVAQNQAQTCLNLGKNEYSSLIDRQTVLILRHIVVLSYIKIDAPNDAKAHNIVSRRVFSNLWMTLCRRLATHKMAHFSSIDHLTTAYINHGFEKLHSPFSWVPWS